MLNETCLKEQRRTSRRLSAMIVPARTVEIAENFSSRCALLPNRLRNFTQMLMLQHGLGESVQGVVRSRSKPHKRAQTNQRWWGINSFVLYTTLYGLWMTTWRRQAVHASGDVVLPRSKNDQVRMVLAKFLRHVAVPANRRMRVKHFPELIQSNFIPTQQLSIGA